MKRCAVIVVAALAAACGRDALQPDVTAMPVPAGSVRVSPLPSALPPISASSQLPDTAPRVARSAPRDVQERAAWDILAGRRPAAELPVESYEPVLSGPPTGDRDLSAPLPQIRELALDVSPGLPPEVIKRISRQSFGRYRLCYENALRDDPGLEGDVVVSYGIDKTGAVDDVKVVGGAVATAKLAACVAKAVRGHSFPEPEDKKRVQVKATYSFKIGISR